MQRVKAYASSYPLRALVAAFVPETAGRWLASLISAFATDRLRVGEMIL